MSELQSQHEAWKAARTRLNGNPQKIKAEATLAAKEAEQLRALIAHQREELEREVRAFKEIIQEHDQILTRIPKRLSILRIIVEHARAEYGCTRHEFFSSARSSNLAWARHLAFYLTRKLTSLSYPSIGRVLKRDHSTVIYGYQKVEARMAHDLEYAGMVTRLLERLSVPQ